jgi:hypothetical protein
MIRALNNSTPIIVGWEGHTKTLRRTPSLNPGLWYNWYPPIASRRQAKKTRTAPQVIFALDNVIWEGQRLLAPVFSTELLSKWMNGDLAGPRFQVGDYKEKAEKGVRAGED